MLVYVYDGTFDGLLTSIFEAYYRGESPDRIVKSTNLQQSLLDSIFLIDTDSEKAQRVYDSVKKKISKNALDNIYYCFLSEHEDLGKWIYEYLKLGWKTGKYIDMRLSDDRVLRIINIRRKVTLEVHRMLGLVRFKLLDSGIYYANVDTDFNILELIAPHFSARLADQFWIIHDVRRALAVIYDRKNWAIANTGCLPEIRESDSESCYQELWKEFFRTICIPNRINPKLQRNNMPVRYWKNLTEKNTL